MKYYVVETRSLIGTHLEGSTSTPSTASDSNSVNGSRCVTPPLSYLKLESRGTREMGRNERGVPTIRLNPFYSLPAFLRP